MRTAVPLVVGLFLLVTLSCSSGVVPVPIRAGDICESCRRQILDTKIAAEIVPPAGRLPMKFRTVSCAARYLYEHPTETATAFVTDYNSGRLIQAASAVFVHSEINANTKELGYYAFRDVKAAVAFSKKTGGASADWPSIQKRIASESSRASAN
jgi:hypothetical protein